MHVAMMCHAGLAILTDNTRRVGAQKLENISTVIAIVSTLIMTLTQETDDAK